MTAPCDPRTSLHKAIRVLRAMTTNRALRDLPFTAIHVSENGRKTIGHLLPAKVRQVVLENPIECENRGIRVFGSQRKVTYCGRLTEEKGADLVAQAARALGLPSLFVGDGPLRERIQAIDRRRRLPAGSTKISSESGSPKRRLPVSRHPVGRRPGPS